MIFRGWTVFPYVWIYVEEESHSIVLIRFDSSVPQRSQTYRPCSLLWSLGSEMYTLTHTHTHTLYTVCIYVKRAHRLVELFISLIAVCPPSFSVSFHSFSFILWVTSKICQFVWQLWASDDTPTLGMSWWCDESERQSHEQQPCLQSSPRCEHKTPRYRCCYCDLKYCK